MGHRQRLLSEFQTLGPREAIERVSGEIIGDGLEVDDRFIGGDVDGTTARDFEGSLPRAKGSETAF